MVTESVLVMMDLKKMEKEYVKVSDFLYLLYHKGLRAEMNEKNFCVLRGSLVNVESMQS